MQVSKETITPKKAMEWLKRNIHNRPLRQSHAERIAKAIELGDYKQNGDTLKFNKNGDLIDGQHRLNAVIISGRSIESYVVRDLDHDAFKYLGDVVPRGTADVFAGMGEPNYKHLSTATKLAYVIRQGAPNDSAVTAIRSAEAVDILNQYPKIRESVSLAQHLDIRFIMSLGQSAALHLLMAEKDEDAANKFWKDVATGEGLKKTMPAYELRQRLIENRSSKAKIKRWAVMAMAIKAWNAVREGKSIKCLKWDEREEFPKIQ